jgi:uncharacterized protein (DUF1015 family)
VAIIKPFRALRPRPEQAALVASVPYDVVNTDEARTLAGDNSLSFLRVSRPDLELPDEADHYADEVYAQAAANFDRLIAAAPLVTENEPSLYLYRLRMGDHEQTGLVASCSVDEYDQDIIRKHERTRRDKEDDRTRHILTLRAQTGPVFLTYRANPVIDELTLALVRTEPLFDFIAPDGIAHTIWKIPAALNPAFEEVFGQVPRLYIADGHHRAKSASRAREVLKAGNSNHTGGEEYNYFQAVIFPDNQLRILPYHRVVRDLADLDQLEFFRRVGEKFDISPGASPTPPGRGHFSIYFEGAWYGLEVRPDVITGARVIDRLDVSLLQDLLLSPILGIDDPRTDKRIDFVGGIRGTRELERLVDSGSAAIAFALHPVTLDELMEISDADEIMPPKSTWFEPKLRDGLLSHLI